MYAFLEYCSESTLRTPKYFFFKDAGQKLSRAQLSEFFWECTDNQGDTKRA